MQCPASPPHDQILKTPLIVALVALSLWVAALCRTDVRGQGGQAQAVQPVIAVALGDTFVRLTLVARMPPTPPETTSSS